LTLIKQRDPLFVQLLNFKSLCTKQAGGQKTPRVWEVETVPKFHLPIMVKHSMAPITVLKKGLDKLKQKVQIRKADIEARPQKEERLTDVDEEWLDNDGNIIQAQCVFEILEAASDYELEYERLDENGKGIVQRLRELGGDHVNKIIGNKRKRMDDFFCFRDHSPLNWYLFNLLGPKKLSKPTKHAQEDTLINGGDDDTDNDCLSEPCPTYKEVLVAISTIRRHLDLDPDPCARELDALLYLFTNNLRRERSKSMKPTLVTD
jgi:hypothetical protein